MMNPSNARAKHTVMVMHRMHFTAIEKKKIHHRDHQVWMLSNQLAISCQTKYRFHTTSMSDKYLEGFVLFVDSHMVNRLVSL